MGAAPVDHSVKPRRRTVLAEIVNPVKEPGAKVDIQRRADGTISYGVTVTAGKIETAIQRARAAFKELKAFAKEVV